MKNKLKFIAICHLLFAICLSVFAQGTAFTYQGQLQNNGSPASGTYNLTFTLFGTNTTGVAIAGPVTNNAVFVTNGLFMVLVDFGPGAFTGATNWLQIGVETNLASPFTTLTPRQQLTPVPYAIYAENAGTVFASQLTSIGNGNGGSGNFFVGPSGNSTTSGSLNTANGADALFSNTSGSYNTANGYTALYSNTSGSANTANGLAALYANTIGYNNTADGFEALYSNTSGWANEAFGFWALEYNSSGFQNAAVGDYALRANTVGMQNSGVGSGAMQYNVGGSQNTAMGFHALWLLGLDNGAGGTNNIAVGNLAASAFLNNESGNIDIGNQGVTGENNIIRIGSGQTSTYIAGVINGDGGGLTDLNASQLTSIGNNNFFVGPSGNSTTTGSQNTANGSQALVSNTSGSQNTANGGETLVFNTSGYGNTANGAYALYSNTSGYENTANGAAALLSNTNGSANTANGVSALQYNTSGNNNTANGASALLSNTNGSENTANGAAALSSNTSGSENTANGFQALEDNTSGSVNIALGYQAGFYISTGSYNIDIGNLGQSTDANIIRIGDPAVQASSYIAGVINGNGGGLTNLNVSSAQLSGTLANSQLANSSITVNPGTGLSGGGAVALGGSTTLNNTGVLSVTGNADITASTVGGAVTLGDTATSSATPGTLVKRDASGNFSAGLITATSFSGAFSGNGGGLTNLNASQLTSIGNGNGGSGNFFVGPSGNSTMSGNANTAIGDLALNANTSGYDNTANGVNALFYNTNGSFNMADGVQALNYNTSGSDNTADGFRALFQNTSGSNNIALGYEAGFNLTTGSSNIDIGNEGFSTDANIIRIGSGQSQTFIAGVINGNGGGLTNINASKLTSIGNNNIFVGSAGNAANSGSDNTAMGAQALTNNTSGTGNTAFGFGALQSATGNFNFGYGYLAGSGLTTGANNVDIAAAGQSSDNAFIRIGTPGIQSATYIAGVSGATAASGVAVYVNSSGQLGTLTSSRRYKQDIQGMDQASDVLYALKPVTFKYKPGIDPQGIPQFGLVAEEVEKVAPDLVAHDDQGKVYTVRYQAVDAMLLNEFLKEHRTVQEQSTEIQNLKQQNDSLEKRLNELEKAVASIAEKSGATFALNSKASANK